MDEQFKYTVCIHCMTYNHEKYLADALEGFVMQKTNFPFVAVVIDDFSTDGTADVLRKYEAKYPDIIKAVYLQENYYSQRKPKKPFLEPYDSQSKYIALCEGDDYWIDPLKLQKQVDFLEAHEEYSMCATRTPWMFKSGEKALCGCRHSKDTDLTIEEIIQGGGLYLNVASIVYRNGVIQRDKYNWWKMADVGDYPLYIAASLAGKVRFFADEMCVYRSQHEGSWTEKYASGNLKHIHNEIDWLSIFDKETNFKYHTAIQIHLFPNFWRALYRMDQLSLSQYIKVYKEAQRPISIPRMIKDIIRHYLKFLRK